MRLIYPLRSHLSFQDQFIPPQDPDLPPEGVNETLREPPDAAGDGAQNGNSEIPGFTPQRAPEGGLWGIWGVFAGGLEPPGVAMWGKGGGKFLEPKGEPQNPGVTPQRAPEGDLRGNLGKFGGFWRVLRGIGSPQGLRCVQVGKGR